MTTTVAEEGAMDRNSDYLTLWTHYEGCGSDDKNRMISTASVLIGFAGALLGASISSKQWVAVGLAILSLVVALMSWVLIQVFKIFADRNFKIADKIGRKLNDDLKAIIKTRPLEPTLLFGFVNKLAKRPDELAELSEQQHHPVTGPIFKFFSTISLFVAIVSVIVALLKMFRLD
jgi:hypothetical protein